MMHSQAVCWDSMDEALEKMSSNGAGGCKTAADSSSTFRMPQEELLGTYSTEAGEVASSPGTTASGCSCSLSFRKRLWS